MPPNRHRFRSMPKPAPVDAIADMPDPILDPKAFARWQVDQLKARDEKIEAFQRERVQETENARRFQLANQLEQQFMAQTPDYGDAVKHVVETRKTVLAAYGYDQARIERAGGLLELVRGPAAPAGPDRARRIANHRSAARGRAPREVAVDG